jgi:RND family efflux transporter MFP subunit
MTLWKTVLPIAVVAAGALGAVAMIKARPEAETRVPTAAIPLVRFETVEMKTVDLVVESQGTVSPRTESVLVSEVAGRVVEVASSFVSGGFFEEGDVLLKIESHDYRQAVVQNRAAVAQAELRLAQEQAEAGVANREWNDVGRGGEPSALTLRQPQIAEAEASVAAAVAALERAQRNLDRTEIRAPYAGRVRTKQVDVGQYVAPGTPIATVYAVDYVEIRLPLPDDQLAYVDLPLVYRGDSGGRKQPAVTLRASFAGRTHEWIGRIVRTEGEIDPRTRMVHAVAQVKDPYARGEDPDRPPLAAGLYVDAEIVGRSVENVATIPRAALRGDDTVLVIDDASRVRLRSVEILRRTPEAVIVSGGLEAGERICTTPLAAVTEGMQVRLHEAT